MMHGAREEMSVVCLIDLRNVPRRSPEPITCADDGRWCWEFGTARCILPCDFRTASGLLGSHDEMTVGEREKRDPDEAGNQARERDGRIGSGVLYARFGSEKCPGKRHAKHNVNRPTTQHATPEEPPEVASGRLPGFRKAVARLSNCGGWQRESEAGRQVGE